jgi:DNA polymerase-3 subunit epsilon
MKALIFDTETTDRLDFKAPITAEHQPHIVQLGAILEDFKSEKLMASVNLLVATEGWLVQPGAAQVHGISQEVADTFGVSHINACYVFRDLVKQADVVVAHNIDFDRQIMIRALAIAGVEEIPWDRVRQRCTMKTGTAVCKVPKPGGRSGFKWPTLTEALQILCGEEMQNAHDAMADVEACRKIHRKLSQMGAFVNGRAG